MTHGLVNLFEQLNRALNLIFHVLAIQTAHALRIDLFQAVIEKFQLIVLTAQPQHKHTAGIGMGDDILQDLHGILMVLSHLGTAERMIKGEDAVDVVQRMTLPEGVDDIAGSIADAANGHDDP